MNKSDIRNVNVSRTEQAVKNDFAKVRAIALVLNLLSGCRGPTLTKAQHPLAVSLPFSAFSSLSVPSSYSPSLQLPKHECIHALPAKRSR